ncbi:MAG TPA: hypothetical protein VF133_10885 [Terriglobales bacterium]
MQPLSTIALPCHLMGVFVTAIGVLLLAAALLDVFQTLFHPAGRGAMSDWTARLVWRVFRRMAARKSKVLTYAGPVSILAIIASWAALTWFGFALIYLPDLQNRFTPSPGENAGARGLAEALSLSIGALITVSEGSYAIPHWLQLLRGLEAVIGFGLLTASVSWLLSIYPVLESRRSVAQRATLLHDAERENQLDMVRDSPRQAEDWIFNLGAALAGLRNQMAQFPITYYFDMGDAETALAGTLSYMLELADRAVNSEAPSLRLSGTVLGGAVHSLLELLARDFLSIDTGDKQAILRAYASEQMTDLILRDRTIAYPRRYDAA